MLANYGLLQTTLAVLNPVKHLYSCIGMYVMLATWIISLQNRTCYLSLSMAVLSGKDWSENMWFLKRMHLDNQNTKNLHTSML